MAMQKATIGALTAGVIGIVTIALVSGLLSASRTLPNTGVVRATGIGVYWDRSCTNETSVISWDTLTPNSTKSYVVYVKNNGTVNVILSMATDGWDPPAASSYISLGWNCSGYTLSRNNVVAAYLTLSVSPAVTGFTNFSFDIIVTGTEPA